MRRSVGLITSLKTWLIAQLVSSMFNFRIMVGVVVATTAVLGVTTAFAVSSLGLDTPLLATGKWKRIFSDEFDAGPLNGKLWTTCYWWNDNGCTNLGNEELQWYTPNNVGVLDGYLRLTARPENIKGLKGQVFTFTSGMVTTGFRRYFKRTALCFSIWKD